MKLLRARFLLLFAVLGCSATAQVLTTAFEVRSLTAAQAEEGREARLRGRVIFFERSAVFLQDETGTTFFRPRSISRLRLGDEIEVRGRTQRGLFLPGLAVAEFTILGHPGLPPPIPASYDELVSARLHYCRVCVEGVVRTVSSPEEGRTVVQLALGSRLLEVRIEAPPEPDRALVDSRVRVCGLAAGLLNERRQLVQPYVRAQDWSEITILDPAPPLAAIPVMSATELLAFRVSGHGRRRVRISGVVTATFPPGRVYLRQDRTAFAADVEGGTALRPGDSVELVGFPEMGGFSAFVAHAQRVHRAPGPPPEPVKISRQHPLAGVDDGDLVNLTAVVGNTFPSETGVTLVLQDGTRTIQAHAPAGTVAPEPGARVAATGIAVVDDRTDTNGYTVRAKTVSLRVRTPEDVVVIESPPWWTAGRLSAVLAVLASVTLLAALWIAALRRQVARQTSALRHRIETEAVLEERQRIAREFHDTLEQELAGVNLRLDALATRELDEKGRQLISGSRNLVSRIQAETRDLIGDLRDTNEAAGDLAAALAMVASRLAAESGAVVRCDVPPEMPALPPATVHALRMIARESVTNALKHGGATDIAIAVRVAETSLKMSVTDNGSGFEPTAAPPARRGHFGCAGMRERARKLGAEIAWRSSVGQGTVVEIVLPLARPAAVVRAD